MIRANGEAFSVLQSDFTELLAFLTQLPREAHPILPSHTEKVFPFAVPPWTSWQRSRSWCQTGTAQRKRKSGIVTVIDPDSEAKKN